MKRENKKMWGVLGVKSVTSAKSISSAVQILNKLPCEIVAITDLQNSKHDVTETT